MSASDDRNTNNHKPASHSPAPTKITSSSTSPSSATSPPSSPPTSPTAATPSASRDAQRERSILFFEPSPKIKKMALAYKTEAAACSASVVATVVAYPLDFVKSRMQGYNIDVRTAVMDAYKKEGPRAFWRGVVPPTVSIALVRTFSFKLYQSSKYWVDARFFELNGRSPMVLASMPGQLPTYDTVACHALAGMLAGTFVTTLSCPFELTKLNMQLAGKEARDKEMKAAQKNGNKAVTNAIKSAANATSNGSKKDTPRSLALFKRQFQEGGFLRIYAGFRLHLARDMLGTAVYFSTYETTKQALSNSPASGINSAGAIAIAGGLCGMTSWAVIIPIDAAKTVYQKARLAAPAGVRVPKPRINYFNRQSYRGLTVSCMRSAVINMLFFTIYESVKTHIDRFSGEEAQRSSRNGDVD